MEDNTWTQDIESILESIRANSAVLTREYKKRHFLMKSTLRYFKIPVIVISAISSIISVGTQKYMEQSLISMTTCVLGLIVSVLGSIELYLKIQQQAEEDIIASREFQILSTEIFKTLSLRVEHRPINGKEFLEKKFDQYIKLIESSNPLAKKIVDSMQPVPRSASVSTSNSAESFMLESP
jgi:spore maturation protein SpmA